MKTTSPGLTPKLHMIRAWAAPIRAPVVSRDRKHRGPAGGARRAVDLRDRLRRTAKVRAEGRRLLLVSPDVLLGDQREADEVGERLPKTAPGRRRPQPTGAGRRENAPRHYATCRRQLREHDRLAFLRACMTSSGDQYATSAAGIRTIPWRARGPRHTRPSVRSRASEPMASRRSRRARCPRRRPCRTPLRLEPDDVVGEDRPPADDSSIESPPSSRRCCEQTRGDRHVGAREDADAEEFGILVDRRPDDLLGSSV